MYYYKQLVINTCLVYFTRFEACHIFPITILKYKNNYDITNLITKTDHQIWRNDKQCPK